ncbi:hypothetical protein F4680DRAFT_401868 [Xylaria scruposa]|nr:hypothetical protein F4680DRAFT_401868 [Xylaria scruposa]
MRVGLTIQCFCIRTLFLGASQLALVTCDWGCRNLLVKGWYLTIRSHSSRANDSKSSRIRKLSAQQPDNEQMQIPNPCRSCQMAWRGTGKPAFGVPPQHPERLYWQVYTA